MGATVQAAEVQGPVAEERCPFYGYTLVHNALVGRGNELVFRLWSSRGNQCALITAAFSPCRLERAGRKPIWGECPLTLPDYLLFDWEKRILRVLLRSDTTEQG